MSYRYPYGNTEQMNLDWFLNQWEKFKADWAEAEAGIDGSLDAEIAKVEAAMSELYAARDAAAASASAARQSSLDAAAAQVAAGNSKTAAQAAETSARGSQQAAEQSAQEAQASAQGAENSALTASQAANTATQQAAGADAARGAAEAAQQAAEDAQAAAAQSAGQAGQAATAAADHADDAADSATLAQQAAQDMSDSVEQITTNKNDISDLKESLNAVFSLEPTLISNYDYIEGKYVVARTGLLNNASTTRATDYIDVSALSKIQYKRTTSTSTNPSSGMAFYDINKQYISGQTSAIGSAEGYQTILEELIVPNNAKYARFTTFADVTTFGEFEIYGIGKLAFYKIININDITWQYSSLSYGIESRPDIKKRMLSNYFKANKGDVISLNNGTAEFLCAMFSIDGRKFIEDNGAFVNTYTLPQDCYIRLYAVKKNRGNINSEEFNEIANSFTITKADASESLKITNIIENIDKYSQAKIMSLKRTDSTTIANCNLRLMWVTDVHGEVIRTRRMAELINEWNLFDAVINTGDLVQTNQADDYSYYYDIMDSISIPFFNAVGNHDSYDSNNIINRDKTIAYNIEIAQMNSLSSIVQPENAAANGLNYYYTDINGIRIIVLDAIYWTDAQKTWFINALSNAKTNSKPVICLSHCSFPWNEMTKIDTLWSKSGFATAEDSYRLNIEAASAVKDFMDEGGTFICWLTGHNHNDDLHYVTNYGNQLVVTADAFVNRLSFDLKSDQPSDYTYDLLTFVTVDLTNGKIKFLRIGANVDMTGTKHEGIILDYVNKEVVSSW